MDKEKFEAALRAREEFLGLYPFRQNPELIARLTPEQLYSPGRPVEYFFYW